MWGKSFFWLFNKLGSKLPVLRYLFTPFIAWGIMLISVINIISKEGIAEGMVELVQRTLAAEYTIHQNVQLAIEKPAEFGLFSLLEIISACFIIFYILKWLTKFQIGDTGAQAWMGALRWSLLIFFLVEILVIITTNIHEIRLIFDVVPAFWDIFTPIKDSFVYLALNFNHIIDAIPILGYFVDEPIPDIEANATNITK